MSYLERVGAIERTGGGSVTHGGDSLTDKGHKDHAMTNRFVTFVTFVSSRRLVSAFVRAAYATPAGSGRLTGFRKGMSARSLAPTSSIWWCCSRLRVSLNHGRPFLSSAIQLRA